jgi:hypothetical protein
VARFFILAGAFLFTFGAFVAVGRGGDTVAGALVAASGAAMLAAAALLTGGHVSKDKSLQASQKNWIRGSLRLWVVLSIVWIGGSAWESFQSYLPARWEIELDPPTVGELEASNPEESDGTWSAFMWAARSDQVERCNLGELLLSADEDRIETMKALDELLAARRDFVPRPTPTYSIERARAEEVKAEQRRSLRVTLARPPRDGTVFECGAVYAHWNEALRNVQVSRDAENRAALRWQLLSWALVGLGPPLGMLALGVAVVWVLRAF